RLPGAELSVSLASANGTNAEPTLVVQEVVPAATETWRDVARIKAQQARVLVLPGTYRVTAEIGRTRVRRRVTVALGQTAAVPLSVRTTAVTLTSKLPEANALKLDERLTYRIVNLDAPDAEPRLLFGARATVNLTPGRYRIESHLQKPRSRAEQTVVISPRRTQSVEIAHQAGLLSMRLVTNRSSAARPDWQVSSGDGTIVWRGIGTSAATLLPPGTYSVTATGRPQFRREVVIKQGETAEVTLAAR
ncbi:MAG: hypothetical protein AAFY64_10615, partial [Pseudomonadota bacterium]